MRNAFTAELTTLAAEDPKLVLLTGDLGFTVLEPFAKTHPSRFFNVGVAEQNMIGLATGLAEAGYVPYAYSIATFASLRGYEFIRNGPLLHNLPVRVVGIGGGVDYGHNGVTHLAVEDVALMRAQPRMTVVVPADTAQTRAALRAVHALDAPVYLRLSKGGGELPELGGEFALGRAAVVGTGQDVSIVTLGPSARAGLAARELLEAKGIAATVVAVTSFNPDPVDDLLKAIEGVPVVLTVEDHYVVGGLGSFVAETVAGAGLGCRVIRCGIDEMPAGLTGSSEYLAHRFGITAEQVADTAARAL